MLGIRFSLPWACGQDAGTTGFLLVSFLMPGDMAASCSQYLLPPCSLRVDPCIPLPQSHVCPLSVYPYPQGCSEKSVRGLASAPKQDCGSYLALYRVSVWDMWGGHGPGPSHLPGAMLVNHSLNGSQGCRKPKATRPDLRTLSTSKVIKKGAGFKSNGLDVEGSRDHPA